MASGIYKWTSASNKIYIGQSIDLERRKYSFLKAKFYTSEGSYIDRARQKYGSENFKYEILEECPIDLLDERETYWINYYESYDRSKGYNLTSGGDGLKNYHHSELTKQKISESNKGKTLSDEAKAKISKANSGRVMSEEAKQKMSESHKGHKMYEKTKIAFQKWNLQQKNPIEQLDDEGNVINTWIGTKECAEYFNLDPSSIRKMLSGKLRNRLNIRKITKTNN